MIWPRIGPWASDVGPAWLGRLDGLLTCRISLAWAAYRVLPIKIAGQMLPAIGFAMILNVMAKKELIPFVLLGYIAIAYLGLPTMGVVMLATCVALIVFWHSGSGSNNAEESEVEFEDGI